ncbi:MAG: hypothetical protein AAF235_07505 [Planctomycetota bacterium]
MTSGYRALCSDFYVNQKVSVKLDLPDSRETILDLFERVRREFPAMSSFRRYREELALESPTTDLPHRWIAIRSANIRSGVVNPEEGSDAYELHKKVLEVSPYFLSISPLDIEYIELLYGFDLAASGNQDAVVAQALLDGSPLASLFEVERGVPMDFQPLLGMLVLGGERDTLDLEAAHTEVHFEVKTRSGPESLRETPGGVGTADPISVYVTLRRYEPVKDVKALPSVVDDLAEIGEDLVASRVLPYLVAPIREAIAADGV